MNLIIVNICNKFLKNPKVFEKKAVIDIKKRKRKKETTLWVCQHHRQDI
jgi:hypothetical protein